MQRTIIRIIRDSIPIAYQVPAKYWFARITHRLEAEMSILPHLLRKDDNVIDVGGNRGLYAYLVYRIGATVHIFEPNKICYKILSAWSKNKKVVSVYNVAVSDTAGTAYLNVPVDDSGIEHDASGSIEHNNFHNTTQQRVDVSKLDDYDFINVNLIKVDVEGHEEKVIDGAAGTIAKHNPALLIEIESRHNKKPISEIFNKIIKLGYSGYYLSNGTLVSIDGFDVEKEQSLEAFSIPGKYINNFLFLSDKKIHLGCYDGILKRKY